MMSDKKTNKGRSSSIFDVFGLMNLVLNIFDPFKIVRNYMLKPILSIFLSYYEMYKMKTNEGIITTQNLVLKVFSMMICLFLIICAAISFYALFYFSKELRLQIGVSPRV